MSEVFRRFRAMGENEQPADDGSISLLMSTSDPVDFGGYREVLSHAAGDVDMDSARALLVNHDPDQIAGTITSVGVDGNTMSGKARIMDGAKLQSGVGVKEAVKSGALRGVSIGYIYSRSDATFNEETRTVTVKKWRLLEATLTPIPADGRAQVRSLHSDFTNKPASPAAIKESAMSDQIPAAIPAANDESKRALEISEARAREAAAVQRAADIGRITKVAESYDLRASEYIDAAKFATVDAALDAMIKAKAEREASTVKGDIGGSTIRMGKDASDKAAEAAVDSLSTLHGIGKPVEKAERGGLLDVAKRHAQRSGHNVSDWSKLDTAAYILGKAVPGSRNANVTSSMFNTVVLANYMDKAVFNGFNNFGQNVTWPIWTRKRMVSDFKTFGSGALDSANLVETAEDLPFPELTKAEGSYTAALGLWGATISLTMQALVNDDLGEFSALLNRAGAIAARTVDKKVYDVVNAATWTSNTTSGIAGLATAADLGELRAAFDTKIGPAGVVLGNTPRYLLVPSCLRNQALTLTTQVQAYPTVTNTNTDLQTVITPYLTQAATPTQSTVYMTGDPNLVDTVTVAFLQGMESPQVAEYDAGAVAARKWKIMLPFVAALATTTVSSTIYIPGMQQGTN